MLLVFLLLASLSILFIRLFLYIVTVDGHSMYPTILFGDRLLVLRHVPRRWVSIGHIVIGDFSKTSIDPGPTQSPYFIKRIVGLPGDVVCIHISSIHKVLHSSLSSQSDSEDNLVWLIPNDMCFVRGDGIIGSDSLLWGPIPLRAISGLVLTKLPVRAID